MAITSKFYTGSVDHVEWAKAAGEVGSSFYGAEDANSWKPTAVSGVDRTVRLGTGVIWGRGVRDTNDTTIDVVIPSVTTGTRWDLIVARRTWGTSTTSVVRIAGTSTKGLPAGRLTGPGVVDDQPLALVKVTAGSTAITELVDLRCFGGGSGGLQALDVLALQYLKFPGALVYVGTEIWTLPAGATDWLKIGNFEGVTLFEAGAAIFGNRNLWVHDKKPFLIQAGSTVQRTDGAGYGRITFPKRFPNGLLTVVAFNGDDDVFRAGGVTYASSGNPVHGPSAWGTATDWVYVVHGYAAGSGNSMPYIRRANQLHRINWIAIGF